MHQDQPPEFSILHLDDEQSTLDEFSDFIARKGKGRFRLKSCRLAEEAISELEQNAHYNLCVVDQNLSQTPQDYSRQIWNGLTFVSYAKIVSPNTSFVLLTNSANMTELKRDAARVGCLDVIRKRTFRKGDPARAVEQLESACMYSKYFIADKSDARLNFSQSVAHSIRSSLSIQRQRLSDLNDQENEKTDFDTERIKAFNQVIGTLREIDSKLTRLLNFYSFNKVNYKTANYADLIERAAREVGISELVSIVGPSELFGTFDEGLLQQAVENVLENSKKAIHGRPAGAIEVFYGLTDELHDVPFVQISISDNGVGLKPGTKHLVAQPTMSFDNLKKGTVSFGLGASEAKKILRMHRVGMICGSYDIDDRTDCRGCVVVMSLPRNCTD